MVNFLDVLRPFSIFHLGMIPKTWAIVLSRFLTIGSLHCGMVVFSTHSSLPATSTRSNCPCNTSVTPPSGENLESLQVHNYVQRAHPLRSKDFPSTSLGLCMNSILLRLSARPKERGHNVNVLRERENGVGCTQGLANSLCGP